MRVFLPNSYRMDSLRHSYRIWAKQCIILWRFTEVSDRGLPYASAAASSRVIYTKY